MLQSVEIVPRYTTLLRNVLYPHLANLVVSTVSCRIRTTQRTGLKTVLLTTSVLMHPT